MSGPGAGTLALHSFLPAELAAIFRDYGHDLTIVRPAPAPELWGAGPGTETRETVRGFLAPAGGNAQAAAAGAGLPVPGYEAYLPYDVALTTPGWHLEYAGDRYYPTADARDEGGQGIVLSVALSSPQQVTHGAG